MKVLSLFDWISCARIALERAWVKVDTYYASEIDKYAIQVSTKNYPDIIHIGNVKDVSISDDIDLLIWWSPCQDLSIAKKDRKGLDWERSWLFREYLRILKEVKPTYFVLENVASMSKADKDIITQEMWVEPIMIDANLVSAQNRKRLFRTNIPNIILPNHKGIRIIDIMEEDVDGKYYFIPRNTVRKTEEKRTFDMSGKGFNSQQDRANHILQQSATLPSSRTEEHCKIFYGDTCRRLTPIECERLQGVPDDYTEWVSNSQRYKTLWNAFNVDVVAHILSFIPR